MLKRIESILFVICVVMVFTAQQVQTRREVPQRREAPQRKEAPQQREASQQREVPQQREAPGRVVHREPPTVQTHAFQPFHQERGMSRVYAFPAPAPVENNRLFHRQHHKNWQPLYNFYDAQYHFYPYVNVTSTVELSADCVTVLFGEQEFYYNQGSFYVQENSGYLAVPPPVGLVVPVIPQHARQIHVNGQIYYRYKGIFYIQVAQGYQVVGPLQVPGNGP